MEINFFELASGWFFNFLDLIMLYLVTHSLIGYKANVALKKLTWKASVLAVVYALAVGLFGYFVSIIIHNAVTTVLMLGIVHLIVKNVAVISFPDKVLIIIFHYLIGHAIIIPILIIINLLNLEFMQMNLLIYTLLVGAVFILCLKIKLDILFIFVSRKLLIKLMFFILVAIFVAAIALASFNLEQVIEYIALFIVLVAIIINCLYLTLKSAHEYMEVMPDVYHDTRELLSILKVKMRAIDDIDELKQLYIQVMELMDLEDNTEEASIQADFEGLILNTIETIKSDKNSHAQVMIDIDYYELHPIVTDIKIAYMLGILLKNAIESLTQKPIFVEILSSGQAVMVKVANEAKHKSQEELNKMLVKSYSTKEKVGRGFGLAKLKRLVEKDKGKISIFQEFHSQEQANYLTVMINF